MKAILLLNMGGPRSIHDVRGFLFRLFSDPHIMRIPWFIRYPLAFLLSLGRQKKAKGIYQSIGGGSPLYEETKKMVSLLEDALGDNYRCYIGMSYVAPFIKEAVFQIKKDGVEEVILCPLYPQYSTTTTASVLCEAYKEIKNQAAVVDIKEIRSFPIMDGFIDALAQEVSRCLGEEAHKGPFKVLFSAHGLPEKIIRDGDPYVDECQQTVAAIAAKLKLKKEAYQLCYQSRVGPMKWKRPFLDEEIGSVAEAGKGVIIVPISFVLENSETLYELDIEYKKLALEQGALFWRRVKTPAFNKDFIDGLINQIRVNAIEKKIINHE